MEIYFLTPRQAYPRLQNLYINPGCTEAHHGNIKFFQREQQLLLTEIMHKIQKKLAVGKIEFVLMKPGVYWDFPFTWGKTIIVLTERIFNKSKLDIEKILIHEWVHLDQRRRPEQYEKYYRRLGFQKAEINFGPLAPYLLRNPDADQYQWIWTDNHTGKVYAPVAILQDCTFHELLVEFDGSVIHQIKNVPAYYNNFGTKRQLYHPNEIVAHQVADRLMKIEFIMTL